MGKAKKRNFRTCINNGGGICNLPSTFSRENAVKLIIENIKQNNLGVETKDIISLFGITAEELSEAGAAYEDLIALKSVLH